MPVIVSELLKKLGPPLVCIAILAVIAGMFYGMHEHVQTLEAQKATAVRAASDAEGQRDLANAQRDVAAAAAASSAQAASQVAAADAAQMAILAKQKDQAVARAGDLAKQLTEIQNAPHTTNCLRSPAIGFALRGLRNGTPASAPAGASAPHPVPSAQGGPIAADVQRRAGGASRFG